MKRIKLSKNEKRVLRNIAADVDYWSEGMGNETLSACVAFLESSRLVRAAWSSGHIVEAAELTELGTAYLLANPSLRNPVDWKWVIGTAIALATLLHLLVACQSLINS